MMASTIWSGWGDGVLQAPVSAPAPEPPLTLSLWLEPLPLPQSWPCLSSSPLLVLASASSSPETS